MKINPDTLRYYRDRCGLSQEDLAEESKLTKKTISRIESGEIQEPRARTIKLLAEALKIAEDTLSRPPDKNQEQDADTSEYAYRKLTTHLSPDANLAFAFIEERYGVKSEDLIEMAPLSFLLLAEASLNWRRARYIDFKSALDRLCHPYLEVTLDFVDTEQVVDFDSSSIKEADIFGTMLRNELKTFRGNFTCNNPFIEYLRRVAAKYAPSLVEIEPSDPSQTVPSYMMRSAKIEELTGGDDRARYALARGYALKRDIPAELLGDDTKEQRVAWLAKRVPEEKWAEHQAAKTDLRALLEKLGI